MVFIRHEYTFCTCSPRGNAYENRINLYALLKRDFKNLGCSQGSQEAPQNTQETDPPVIPS